MASAAISSPRLTAGYFKVPNSFAENQHLLKLPASRALALLVFKAESEREARISKGLPADGGIQNLTETRWESWTGFKDRQKEYAIKELREFGLNIDGRGDTAKFSWDWNRWNHAIKNPNPNHQSPNHKPKERVAKPGAKVHEECHEHGCARLRECVLQSSTNVISPFLVPAIAQHSAQAVAEATEKVWAATFAALCSFFPLIGVLFLSRLLAIVRGIFPTITDAELAEAVQAAYVPEQYSPKLFLLSVPNTIAKLRRQKKVLEVHQANDGVELPHILPGIEPGRPKKKRAVDFL